MNGRVGLIAIKVQALGLSASLAFLLITVIDKDVVKTEMGFLVIPDINFCNGFFSCNYNI